MGQLDRVRSTFGNFMSLSYLNMTGYINADDKCCFVCNNFWNVGVLFVDKLKFEKIMKNHRHKNSYQDLQTVTIIDLSTSLWSSWLTEAICFYVIIVMSWKTEQQINELSSCKFDDVSYIMKKTSGKAKFLWK